MKEYSCPDCKIRAGSCHGCPRVRFGVEVSGMEEECKGCPSNPLNIKSEGSGRPCSTCPVYKRRFDVTSIPGPCRGCPNHPINGGTGICNCTLGTIVSTCTASF